MNLVPFHFTTAAHDCFQAGKNSLFALFALFAQRYGVTAKDAQDHSFKLRGSSFIPSMLRKTLPVASVARAFPQAFPERT